MNRHTQCQFCINVAFEEVAAEKSSCDRNDLNLKSFKLPLSFNRFTVAPIPFLFEAVPGIAIRISHHFFGYKNYIDKFAIIQVFRNDKCIVFSSAILRKVFLKSFLCPVFDLFNHWTSFGLKYFRREHWKIGWNARKWLPLSPPPPTHAVDSGLNVARITFQSWMK